MKKTIILSICLVVFALFGFAQVKNETATEVFERGFGTPKPTRTRKPTPTRKPNGQTPIPNPTTVPKTSVGKGGMKIWLEKQVGCDESKWFIKVAPTSVFYTGDCVRAKFQLNFPGYLTIYNLGTSGVKKKLFPKDAQSKLILPKKTDYLPHEKGWRFEGEPGTEQLFFVVSKLPLKSDVIDESVGCRDLTDDCSTDMEIRGKDLVEVTENDEVFVMGDETRLEKPIVFRLALKHR